MSDTPPTDTLSYRRRAVLGTLAAGAGVTAIGAGLAHEDDGDHDADDVHPVFGFPATSRDVTPPIDPDHEVRLRKRPREVDLPHDGTHQDDDHPHHDDEHGPEALLELIPEWFFDPVGLSVEPGATVQFTLESHLHTITAIHPQIGFERRVPEAVGPVSSPVLWDGSYFLYTFDEPGVYDLLSLPHGLLGMVTRIVVGEATGPAAQPVPTPEFGKPLPDPDEPIPVDWIGAQVLRDPAMEPVAIIEQETVQWDDLEPESKQFPMEQLMPHDHGNPLLATLALSM